MASVAGWVAIHATNDPKRIMERIRAWGETDTRLIPVERQPQHGDRQMTQIFNPLKFWCAPNQATPDYVTYDDFQQFIAYGLMVC